MARRSMSVLFAVCLSVVPAAEVSAQVSARLTGGLTNAAQNQPFFGGGVAIRLGVVEIEAEAGRMVDVLPGGVLDRLNALQMDRDLPVRAIAQLPVKYAMGSLRLVSSAGPLQPFIAVGGGVARIEPRFTIVVEGISLGDVFGLTSQGSVTEPLVTAGAGLRFDVERVTVDVGYRYLAIMTNFGLANGFRQGRTDISSLYGTIGVVF